jgi:hypothetical protein
MNQHSQKEDTTGLAKRFAGAWSATAAEDALRRRAALDEMSRDMDEMSRDMKEALRRVFGDDMDEMSRDMLRQAMDDEDVDEMLAKEPHRGAPPMSPSKPQPRNFAAFLVRAFAKSPNAAESVIGDMHERFANHCAKYGVRRARLYCWADTLHSLWPLLRRALGRTLKWAAIISAVKRYFTG